MIKRIALAAIAALALWILAFYIARPPPLSEHELYYLRAHEAHIPVKPRN